MRTKECIELAKRSLKIHKKSNRSTIIALALGFALLIPVMSAMFGVNVSISGQLNKTPYLLYFETKFADYRIETDDYNEMVNSSEHINISGSKNIDYVTDNKNIERAIIYEQFGMNNFLSNKTMDLSVDGSDFKPIAYTEKSNYSIIDAEKSDGFFPENLVKHYPKGIFLDGCDAGFSGDGKGQVVLSERFINTNGISANSVYLKNITIKNNDKLNIVEGDENPVVDGYLCQNYKVVGIIKDDVTALYNENSFMSSDLFFSSASVYDENGNAVLKPYYFIYGHYASGYKKYYLKYDNWENKEILNEEYMFIGWYPVSMAFNSHNNETFSTSCVYAESSNYARLNSDIKKLNNRFSEATGYRDEYAQTSMLFESYNKIYNLTNIVSLVLLVVSIVIGFSALLNMFNTISHSVKTRGQYLTMMRAIGAKDRDIPRLYMTESAIICSIAGAVMAAVGFLLSMALKLIYESVLKTYKVTISLGIPWWVIIVTTLSTVIAVYAVCILFSYISTKRLSKVKIPTVLNNN